MPLARSARCAPGLRLPTLAGPLGTLTAHTEYRSCTPLFHLWISVYIFVYLCLVLYVCLGCVAHTLLLPCLRLSMDPLPPTGSGAPSDADNLASRSDLTISPRCAAPSARRSDDNLDDNKLHGFHLPILLRILQSPTHATQSDGKSETGSELSCLDTVYYR